MDRLRSLGPKGQRITNTCPGNRLYGWLEATLRSVVAVGNALEDVDATVHEATNFARGGCGNGSCSLSQKITGSDGPNGKNGGGLQKFAAGDLWLRRVHGLLREALNDMRMVSHLRIQCKLTRIRVTKRKGRARRPFCSSSGWGYFLAALAVAKRLLTSSQLTVFHHAAR
jgi:hypothetical protein